MRYKLIKKYPGSPPLGLEIKQNGMFWESEFTTKNVQHFHEKFNPKDYPEFWEEVVEKDYEVISLIGNHGSRCIYTLEKEGIFVGKIGRITEFPHGNHGCDIYSVKRKSDGEIFTVGDKIFPNNKIYKFELKNDILTIWHYDISFSTPVIKGPSGQPGNCSWIKGIDNLKKIKQPLFTTEDGVDIFKNDEYYYINSSFNNPWEIVNTKADHPDLINKNDLTYKRFSTKEAAEEYILMNKPKYSLNDILISLPNKHCEKYVSIKSMIANLKNM